MILFYFCVDLGLLCLLCRVFFGYFLGGLCCLCVCYLFIYSLAVFFRAGGVGKWVF